MEIAEYIYEGIVESYKKPTRIDTNCSGIGRKTRGEAALSTTYYKMSESAGKRRRSYAEHIEDRSKLTCLVHGPVHSSD